MRSVHTGLWAAALLAGEAASQGVAGSYCDELGRCFVSRTMTNGVVYAFALPEVDAAPFKTILQITAPITTGWAGFSWGSGMTYQPLAVVWANGDSVQISSRMAFAYALPPPYDGATYTLLDGSFVNETHFVATAVCDGCSIWDGPAGVLELDPSGSNVFAYASSSNPVDEPDNVDTTFGIHQAFGLWAQDLADSQSPDFDEWAAGTGGEEPPASSSTAPPVEAPTSAEPEQPAPTGAAPAVPSSCGMESNFPLEAAEGWSWVKIAGGLRAPRGMVVDSKGNLIVVEQGKGVSVHTIGPDGCIASTKSLIANYALNHGIALTPDGAHLIVSSMASAWRYDYDAEAQSVSGEQVVVKGMEPGGHTTRTAVIPPDTPDLLILSVGSKGNLDGPSIDKSVGRALLKVFNLTSVPEGGYDYTTSGWYLGYGLRNEVAVVVDKNNMIWGVENSADEFERTVDGVATDIHEDNPAEELNFLGDPSVPNEKWYGYPTCFTVWSGELFPDGNPGPGSQFIPAPNGTWTDARCEEESTPPRLTLQAHSAPIDGKFDEDNSNLYVSLHGSWNRDVPYGFKVVQIPFGKNSQGLMDPVAAQDSATGYNDILWDTQEGCSSSKCFRPSGIVWDKDFTRMYIGSDNSREGELYILHKTG
jgi:glucose/arabinose dehydrogenase